MPQYVFKPTPEFCWFVVNAVSAALAAGVALQGSTPPTDWRAWGLGVAVAALRPIVGLFFSTFSKSA